MRFGRSNAVKEGQYEILKLCGFVMASEKRQRTAALQDLAEVLRANNSRERHGVRLSSAAFAFGLLLPRPVRELLRKIYRAIAFDRDRAHCVCHGLLVTTTEAIRLLEKFKAGGIGREKVLQAFLSPPVADLGFAKVDLHRALRKGFPEVIFGSGKTPEQVVRIAAKLAESENCVLITRVGPEHARAVGKSFKNAVHHEQARCITIEKHPTHKRAGTIAVVCAGTSDLPVAEEASVTAEIMGNQVERIVDVGVAGIHRLFEKLGVIQSANVVIVVAGMEGALPSVVAGLVRKPVIAVPTSVGYGASFGGLAALLGMLNSCGSGVTVVNIDNGFGAGYAASQINALLDDRNL